MAGRGRGRGRGLLAQVAFKPPVPGGGNDAESKVSPEVSAKKDARAEAALRDLKEEVKSLATDGNDPTDDDLQRMEQLATVALTRVEDTQMVAGLLYEKVVENRDYAKAVAMVCDKLSAMDKEGMRFRSTVLSLVQVDYKAREELKNKSRDRFLGCVTFLSHLFGTLRLANGEVMQPLVGPIYDCMDLILDGDRLDDVEAECVSLQLQTIGRELQEHGEERMQQLMNLVRNKIIREHTKPQIRCYLLELLESYTRRWQLAPNDVTRFYLDTMADIFAGLVLDS